MSAYQKALLKIGEQESQLLSSIKVGNKPLVNQLAKGLIMPINPTPYLVSMYPVLPNLAVFYPNKTSSTAIGSLIYLTRTSTMTAGIFAKPSDFQTQSYKYGYSANSYSNSDILGWKVNAYGSYTVKCGFTKPSQYSGYLEFKTRVDGKLMDDKRFDNVSGTYTYTVPNVYNGDYISTQIVLGYTGYSNFLSFEMDGPIPPVADPTIPIQIANMSGWISSCDSSNNCANVISSPTGYNSVSQANSNLVSFDGGGWIANVPGRMTIKTTTFGTMSGSKSSYSLEFVLSGSQINKVYPLSGVPYSYVCYAHCAAGDRLVVNGWALYVYDFNSISFELDFQADP